MIEIALGILLAWFVIVVVLPLLLSAVAWLAFAGESQPVRLTKEPAAAKAQHKYSWWNAAADLAKMGGYHIERGIRGLAEKLG